jgi:hypothetical chaperone protein
VPALLPLEDGKPTLPSAVFFNADEESTHYGRDALQEYLEGYEGRLMRALKSLLGSNLMEGSTEVGGRALRYSDLLASFIGELKRRRARGRAALRPGGVRPPGVLCGRQPAADRRAQDTLEPSPARWASGGELPVRADRRGAALRGLAGREELVLIADIGGGTADFSLVRLSPERARHVDRHSDLLGNAGLHVGGTDFDRALSLECVMPLLGHKGLMKSGAAIPSGLFFQLATWHTINFAYTRQAFADFQHIYRDATAKRELDRLARLIGQREGHWLALQVEQAKIELSAGASTRLQLDRLEPGLEHDISREDFAQATHSLVERVARTVDELLTQAGVARERVDSLYFTGGASGVPQLRARIAAELPRARCVEGDLFGSIGAGLAVEAARRYG